MCTANITTHIGLLYDLFFFCSKEICSFTTNGYFKYHLTDCAFVRFNYYLIWPFNQCLLQISHRILGICKIYFCHILKKHDLLNKCPLQIFVYILGICKYCFCHVLKIYDLSITVYCKNHITYWAFVRFIFVMFWRNMTFKLMCTSNIPWQIGHL